MVSTIQSLLLMYILAHESISTKLPPLDVKAKATWSSNAVFSPHGKSKSRSRSKSKINKTAVRPRVLSLSLPEIPKIDFQFDHYHSRYIPISQSTPVSPVSLKIQFKISLKIDDLVEITTSNWRQRKLLGFVNKVNTMHTEYYVQFLQVNTSNAWISEKHLKKLPVAYFHAIEDVDDSKSQCIIDRYVSGDKRSNNQILLPYKFWMMNSADKDHSILSDTYYYYQSNATYFLKLMTEFLVTLSAIKMELESCSNGSKIATNVHSLTPWLVSILHQDFARLLRFADYEKLKRLFDDNSHKNRQYSFLKKQFSKLLEFAYQFAQIKSLKQSELHHQLRSYLEENVFHRLVVDVWMDMIVSLIIDGNVESSFQFHGLIQYLQMLRQQHGVQYMIEDRNSISFTQVADNLHGNISKFHGDILSISHTIWNLAVDNLALFDAVQFVTYLNFWMIQKQTIKDIHIFVHRVVATHPCLQAYLYKLANTGVVHGEQFRSINWENINITWRNPSVWSV